jgi:hypothetical protein
MLESMSEFSRQETTRTKRILWSVGAGVGGAGLLSLLYFVIVSLAESSPHAVERFWADSWIVIPIILGFGAQAALYVILKKRLFVPVASTGASDALTGAGGDMSAIARVACCAHHPVPTQKPTPAEHSGAGNVPQLWHDWTKRQGGARVHHPQYPTRTADHQPGLLHLRLHHSRDLGQCDPARQSNFHPARLRRRFP